MKTEIFKSHREFLQRVDKRIAELREERDTFKSLTLLITADVIDLVRCGIGCNYGGDSYEEKMNETHAPILKASGEAQSSLQAHNLKQREESVAEFCCWLIDNGEPIPEEQLQRYGNDYILWARNQAKALKDGDRTPKQSEGEFWAELESNLNQKKVIDGY